MNIPLINLKDILFLILVIGCTYPINAQPLTPYFSVENKKYGYKNAKGDVVIEAQYNKASPFKQGIAEVVKENSTENSYITLKGNPIAPTQYRLADSLFYSKELTTLVRSWKTAGKLELAFLDVITLGVSAFIRGDFAGRKTVNETVTTYRRTNKVDNSFYLSYGNRLENGITTAYRGAKVVIYYGYSESTQKEYDYISKEEFNTSRLFVVFDNDKKGYLNDRGKELLPPIYDKIRYDLFNDLFIAVQKDRLLYFDGNGHVLKDPIIVCKRPDVTATYGSFFGVDIGNGLTKTKKNKKEIIYFGYKESTDNEYDQINDWDKGGFRVTNTGKFGYLNHDGKEIIPTIYDNLQYDELSKDYKGILNTEIVYLDENGRKKSDSKIQRLTNDVNAQYLKAWGDMVGNGITKAKRDKKEVLYMGYAESSKAEYNEIGSLETQRCISVRQGNNYGLLDERGKEVVPPNYKTIKYTSWGDYYLLTTTEGKLGGYLINTGKIIEAKYDRIEWDNMSDTYRLTQDKKVGRANNNGKVVVPPICDILNYNNMREIFEGQIDGKKVSFTLGGTRL